MGTCVGWFTGITKIASLSPGRALSSHCLFVSSHSLHREHSWSCVNESWHSTDLWEGPDPAPPHSPKCCESYWSSFIYSTTVGRKAIPLPQIKMWNVPVMFCSHKSAPGKVLKLRCWQTMQNREMTKGHITLLEATCSSSTGWEAKHQREYTEPASKRRQRRGRSG